MELCIYPEASIVFLAFCDEHKLLLYWKKTCFEKIRSALESIFSLSKGQQGGEYGRDDRWKEGHGEPGLPWEL